MFLVKSGFYEIASRHYPGLGPGATKHCRSVGFGNPESICQNGKKSTPI